MAKKRFKCFAEAPVLPGNVLVLEAFRQRAVTQETRQHTLFYLTDTCRWLPLLASFPFLQIQTIPSLLLLKSRLLAYMPDLILVESKIQWEEPVALIETLTSLLDIPVVMIYSPKDVKKNPDLLKRAFTVGMHDTLRTPLKRDELWEALDVLLKYRSQVSLTP